MMPLALRFDDATIFCRLIAAHDYASAMLLFAYALTSSCRRCALLAAFAAAADAGLMRLDVAIFHFDFSPPPLMLPLPFL